MIEKSLESFSFLLLKSIFVKKVFHFWI